MIGVLKINRNGTISKSGFKYVRFNPGFSSLSARMCVVHKGVEYSYDPDIVKIDVPRSRRNASAQSSKLYFQYDENDITAEAMASIVLGDCRILNETRLSGTCYGAYGKRTIIVDTNYKLAPIMFRTSTGNQAQQSDTFIFSNTDYIEFEVSWQEDQNSRTIHTSLPAGSYDDEELWNKLYETQSFTREFLTRQELRRPSNLKVAIENNDFMNRCHLNRFSRKYGQDFLASANVELSQFRNMDVVELTNLNEVQITNPEDMNNYKVFEILSNSIRVKGTGLTEESLAYLEDDERVFYYLAIDNSNRHRIRTGEKTILRISTRSNFVPLAQVETTADSIDQLPEILFIKFNKKAASDFIANNAINKLEQHI